jgi:hypothetical protein
MTKAELIKTIEARRLNPRTMRSISQDPVTIPFGGILDRISKDEFVIRFSYLGQPYEADLIRVKSAYKPIE